MINDFVKPLIIGLGIMAMVAGFLWSLNAFPLFGTLVGWIAAIMFIGVIAILIGKMVLDDDHNEDSHGA